MEGMVRLAYATLNGPSAKKAAAIRLFINLFDPTLDATVHQTLIRTTQAELSDAYVVLLDDTKVHLALDPELQALDSEFLNKFAHNTYNVAASVQFQHDVLMQDWPTGSSEFIQNEEEISRAYAWKSALSGDLPAPRTKERDFLACTLLNLVGKGSIRVASYADYARLALRIRRRIQIGDVAQKLTIYFNLGVLPYLTVDLTVDPAMVEAVLACLDTKPGFSTAFMRTTGRVKHAATTGLEARGYVGVAEPTM